MRDLKAHSADVAVLAPDIDGRALKPTRCDQDSSYLRPREDVVLRVQDDRKFGGPDSTLVVGTARHVADFLKDVCAVQTRDQAHAALVSVQRWDQPKRRWRGLSAKEWSRLHVQMDERLSARQHAVSEVAQSLVAGQCRP